jgi:hypothetical protein
VRVLRPEAFEGDLVFGLLAGAAGLHDLVGLAMLGHLGLAKLEAEAAGVHGPNVTKVDINFITLNFYKKNIFKTTALYEHHM